MKALLTVGVFLSLVTSAQASTCPSHDRAVLLSSLFAEGGMCATLPESSRDAVRNYDDAKALEVFRGIKAEWIKHFDAGTEGTLGYNLGLRYAAMTSCDSVFGLFKAVDEMRPMGGTTMAHIHAIENAMRDIPLDQLNEQTVADLNGAALGLSDIKAILHCRLADTERLRKIEEAKADCPEEGTNYPSRAADFSVFLGQINQYSGPSEK